MHRIFYTPRFGRILDKAGYVRFRCWRLYGEAGLARRPAAVWLYRETLTVEFADQPIAQYSVAYQPGDTILETARRGGIAAPYSCEAGNCATCMALLRDGTATMRANNALTEDEIEEGWVLTCQALPKGRSVTVEYEAL